MAIIICGNCGKKQTPRLPENKGKRGGASFREVVQAVAHGAICKGCKGTLTLTMTEKTAQKYDVLELPGIKISEHPGRWTSPLFLQL